MKMNNQSAMEFRAELRRRNMKNKQPPRLTCVAKSLYDAPPQSRFFFLQWFYNAIHSYLKFISKFVLGQFSIDVFDYYMVQLEKVFEFCVPSAYRADNNGPKSWLIFIPVLIAIRLGRFWLSTFSIILGQGEVTSRELLMKMVHFRRYYRSVRHYAVKRLTPEEKLLKERRIAASPQWMLYYAIIDNIFMKGPPVEHHSDNSGFEEDQTDKNAVNGKKRALNGIDDGEDDDNADNDELNESDFLTTSELLNKFGAEDDTSADPDYVPPEDEPSSEELSTDEFDTEEEKTESQRKLNEGHEGEIPTDNSFDCFTSDAEANEKSKESGLGLDEKQLNELENQLVMKIMKHFKDNFNYSPSTPMDDVFYSPTESPPERNFNLDQEISKNRLGEPQNNHFRHDYKENRVFMQINNQNSPEDNSSNHIGNQQH
ncbi:CLUMA_CG021377, isoform B [Clunio marinus]|uniref:CLUMA_CG021377, isoform B n=1 Tax=Clunio marinus TaxID=568069 RepID=A0A1J1JAQ6_9DIPT|nr:CLUMA_CG021377, isoform B [Clunio marinus]